jgi:hypothetical protein
LSASNILGKILGDFKVFPKKKKTKFPPFLAHILEKKTKTKLGYLNLCFPDNSAPEKSYSH